MPWNPDLDDVSPIYDFSCVCSVEISGMATSCKSAGCNHCNVLITGTSKEEVGDEK